MTELPRRALLGGLLGLTTLLCAPAAHAQADRFLVELRIIEGTRSVGGGKQVVDPRLSFLAKDLKALPFSEVKLLDVHKTTVREGNQISMELPRSNPAQAKGTGRRFLQVAAHGRQAGGKLRFQLSIEALKFDTLVAVPDGGTIVVAMPKSKGPAMLVAFTARRQ